MFKKKSTIIKNNLYILNYVKEASPWFVTLTVGISLTAFVDTISNTWLSKIVFDGMAQNTPYMEILTAVLILLGIMMISAIAKTLFNHIKSPVETEKIKLHIRSTLYKKTRHLDLFCFEDPDFYDEYTRALAEADTRESMFWGLSPVFPPPLYPWPRWLLSSFIWIPS